MRNILNCGLLPGSPVKGLHFKFRKKGAGGEIYLDAFETGLRLIFVPQTQRGGRLILLELLEVGYLVCWDAIENLKKEKLSKIILLI